MARPDREAPVGVLTGARTLLDTGVTQDVVLRAGGRITVILLLAVTLVAVGRRWLPRAVGRLADVPRHDERWEQRTRTLSHTVRSVLGVVVWVLAAVMVLGEIGVNLGPLIAGAGVVGVAVGFGAQQLVRDVITGFFVLVEDQYGVGDRVTIGAVSGTVETMSLRLTQVRGDDGVLHYVRNGDLSVVSNASRGYGVATVTVPVPPDRDPVAATERVRAAMAGLVTGGSLDDLLLADPQVLGVTEVRADGVPVLSVTARVTPDGRARIQRELLQAASAAVAAPDAVSRRGARRGTAR